MARLRCIPFEDSVMLWNNGLHSLPGQWNCRGKFTNGGDMIAPFHGNIRLSHSAIYFTSNLENVCIKSAVTSLTPLFYLSHPLLPHLCLPTSHMFLPNFFPYMQDRPNASLFLDIFDIVVNVMIQSTQDPEAE